MARISVSAAERILKMAGAERVSAEAAREFAEVIERIGMEIATGAVELANHAGRRTVKASDVKLASRM